MGLLPCIRRGSERWWLPCSAIATEALGDLMLSRSRGPLDRMVGSRVLAALEADPPLFLFAILHCRDERVETAHLADWLARHVTGRFASGDAFLGAPEISPSVRQRWQKLYDHFRVVPIEQWLEDAPLWLEVLGPKVSTAWQQQWPRTVTRTTAPIPGDPVPSEPAPDGMLQRLARLCQRHRSLESSFDRRLQRNKMAALQELAYGLSHEINNPLANISTRAQQLQRGEQDPARVATLQRIIDQVYRAHEMIADLMFYANPPQAKAESCDLNAIVQGVADSFRPECQRQHIRLEITVPEQPTTVRVDPDLIGEATRVMIRNAVEAVGCQGTIVVSVARNGDRVKLHVADSGPGLSEAARQHAFDPYFSGREAGRGLGLGLCRAYRIAQLHHSEITLAGGPAGCVATMTFRLSEVP